MITGFRGKSVSCEAFALRRVSGPGPGKVCIQYWSDPKPQTYCFYSVCESHTDIGVCREGVGGIFLLFC